MRYAYTTNIVRVVDENNIVLLTKSIQSFHGAHIYYLHALARNKNSVNNDGKINKEIGQAINYLRVTKGLNTESLDEYKKNFLHYIKRNKNKKLYPIIVIWKKNMKN